MTFPARAAAPSVVALMAAVFVADTLTDLEITVAVFYVVPILLSARALPRRGVRALAVGCVALAALSSLLTAHGAWEAGLTNLAISSVAILITTQLTLRLLAAEAAFGEARAQLIRVSRVSNLGALASSIAHEVNQPLGAIASSAGAGERWLAADPPGLEQARASLRRIADDARRASAIVVRIRRLSQRHAVTRMPVDLNEVARDALALTARELDAGGIVVRADLATDLPPVAGDRIQLQQVVGNLLSNAVEALADIPREQRTITLSSEVAADGRVTLSVADSGIGIPAEHLPHIFDSLWTSREGGTGLGLTIAQTIVEAHGGRIAAHPAAPGTRMAITLPASEEPR
ncbi:MULTISPECIES: sensor histidine kinase [unclassified Sphingomonas]|uniref:sensor histidine kinase n=1 Tax=unclassified Sphingomonas TaxID=196159 RepID=UPI0006FD16EC|nr:MULTISPECIES: ATP-binding protein [unclassified Sphingomonas]KQM23841.1 hypothetical protein ASE58_16190 [Sphingomonas sp. Leaf9]KQM41968.1 hypothetical protein ASE57_16190 [Sphingomonas sp. Leaf11]